MQRWKCVDAEKACCILPERRHCDCIMQSEVSLHCGFQGVILRFHGVILRCHGVIFVTLDALRCIKLIKCIRYSNALARAMQVLTQEPFLALIRKKRGYSYVVLLACFVLQMYACLGLFLRRSYPTSSGPRPVPTPPPSHTTLFTT